MWKKLNDGAYRDIGAKGAILNYSADGRSNMCRHIKGYHKKNKISEFKKNGAFTRAGAGS